MKKVTIRTNMLKFEEDDEFTTTKFVKSNLRNFYIGHFLGKTLRNMGHSISKQEGVEPNLSDFALVRIY